MTRSASSILSFLTTAHVAALKNVGLSGDADATDVGDIHLWKFS